MSKLLRVVLLLLVIASGFVIAAPAGAADVPPTPPIPPPGCQLGQLSSGAWTAICVPQTWNGGLIVYAHGYVAPDEPLDFYNLEIPNGPYLPTLVQSLGFAFATTTYSRNGLAILQGVDDVRELAEDFWSHYPQRGTTYIAGASEGGAVTTLSVERSKAVFDAGFSLCGPIGDFRKQIDYWGDFRVLFDYFFPGVLPPDAMNIPPDLMAGWEDVYQLAVVAALQADPLAAAQLIRTSKAAIDRYDPTSIGNTTAGLLWYNVHSTNDGVKVLGGIPYDNWTRIYRGSVNDVALNAAVQRVQAVPSARAALGAYDTNGRPLTPLITMHTTGDEIVPFWHQTLYRRKLSANGSTNSIQLPINRYGHCNFTTNEVLVGFSLMVLSATGQPMFVPEQYDISADSARLQQAAKDYGMTYR
jgi:hypothetical protein